MKTIVLKNGRLIDPANNGDQNNCDIWVHEGDIIAPMNNLPGDAAVYDLDGKWIVPGLVDMHVHLREPGEEYKETIRKAGATFNAIERVRES